MASGLVTGLRWKVYQTLHYAPALTANEVAQNPVFRGHQLDSIRPRFAELESLGVIRSSGSRECSVTRMTALLWETTDYVPTKADVKPKTRTFWLVKAPGKIGKVFEHEENAAKAMKDGAELIEVREVVRKTK